MNFGFSGGDIALVVRLAHKAYKGWKRACGEYADITSSLDALLINLERIKAEAEHPNSVLLRTSKDRKDLEVILSACEPTVRKLGTSLSKYKDLGRSRQRNWQRLRFGIKNLDELRTKLGCHISAVTLYLNTVGVASLKRVERGVEALPERIQIAVDDLTEEIRAGRREGSILTTYGDDEKEVWKQLRRELISVGMTSVFIHKYKPRIKRYLQDLAERGELDERVPEESCGEDKIDEKSPELHDESEIDEEFPSDLSNETDHGEVKPYRVHAANDNGEGSSARVPNAGRVDAKPQTDSKNGKLSKIEHVAKHLSVFLDQEDGKPSGLVKSDLDSEDHLEHSFEHLGEVEPNEKGPAHVPAADDGNEDISFQLPNGNNNSEDRRSDSLLEDVLESSWTGKDLVLILSEWPREDMVLDQNKVDADKAVLKGRTCKTFTMPYMNAREYVNEGGAHWASPIVQSS